MAKGRHLAHGANPAPATNLYRHEKVARFWRPSRVLGDGQHRGQVASQLDPELALVRRQDDRFNEPSERQRLPRAAITAIIAARSPATREAPGRPDREPRAAGH